MYDIVIDVYSTLPVDLDTIVLLLASILLAVIVTAEVDYFALPILASYQVSYIYNNNSKDMFCIWAFLILCALFE